MEVFREGTSHEVHALRGPGLASVQFHPESVLTRNGVELLHDVIDGILTADRPVLADRPENAF